MQNINLKKVLAIGIGVILGVVVIFLAFTFLQGILTRATDVKPQDVIISGVTENSAKVTWTTDQETLSNIEYGTSPTSLTFSAPEVEKAKNHAVDLTLLSKNTTYYFQIAVGEEKFDNGGIPWTFTTKSEGDVQTGGETVPTASPTATLNLTPTVTLAPSPTAATGTCNYTNCEDMKANFGKGCTTQDYFKCVRSATPTP
jgi:hypothetical protein